MKKIFQFLILATVMVVGTTISTLAQDVSPPTSFDAIDFIEKLRQVKSYEDLLLMFNPIMTVLIIIGGYLSAKIPLLKSITSGTYRVLTFGVIVIAAFSLFGLAPVWQGLLSYFLSTGLYKYLLKVIIPSPKPVGETQ